MIKGTNADCRLIKTEISESTAILTFVIFASKSTVPALPFQFYIQESGSQEMKPISTTVYWIDKLNNYNNDLNNVDTNKYKEIIVQIDITNNNTSMCKGNRWIRKCFIHLIKTDDPRRNVAWSTGLLELISDEFEIPQIKSFNYFCRSDGYVVEDGVEKEKLKLNINFTLSYKSERDFNFNNSNFKAIVNIYSPTTDKLLESKELSKSALSLENTIETDNWYSYSETIKIELIITNILGEIFYRYSKNFKPTKQFSTSFIKTDEGVKKIFAFYVRNEE